MIAVRHAVLSDRGLCHERNEDRWFADADSGLYFVSDGMANEPTPQLVLDRLPALARDAADDLAEFTPTGAGAVLQGILSQLNNEARAADGALRWHSGIVGATLVLALVRANDVLLVHVGDSRIYLHRDGSLEPMTRDHSIVQEMLDDGRITASQADDLRCNGGPTRFIGMPGKIVPDIRVLQLQPGDRLLLCSDGLTEMLKDSDISAILNVSRDLSTACQNLVSAANARGGRDNVTVLLIEAEAIDSAA